MNNKIIEATTKSRKSSKRQNKTPLPWWVEILFVQIGLPDKWLIKFLSVKKSSSSLFLKNRKLFAFIFLIVLGSIYLSPVIKNSKSNLTCQRLFKQLIKDTEKNSAASKEFIQMRSVNYCNGGNS